MKSFGITERSSSYLLQPAVAQEHEMTKHFGTERKQKYIQQKGEWEKKQHYYEKFYN